MKYHTNYIVFGNRYPDRFDQVMTLRIRDFGFHPEKHGIKMGYTFGHFSYYDKFKPAHKEVIIRSYDSISGIHDPVTFIERLKKRGWEPAEVIANIFRPDANGNVDDPKLCAATSAIVMAAHDDEMAVQQVYRISVALYGR